MDCLIFLLLMRREREELGGADRTERRCAGHGRRSFRLESASVFYFACSENQGCPFPVQGGENKTQMSPLRRENK